MSGKNVTHKRKRREIYQSDAEWTQVKAAAGALDMQVSAFVRHCSQVNSRALKGLTSEDEPLRVSMQIERCSAELARLAEWVVGGEEHGLALLMKLAAIERRLAFLERRFATAERGPK